MRLLDPCHLEQQFWRRTWCECLLTVQTFQQAGWGLLPEYAEEIQLFLSGWVSGFGWVSHPDSCCNGEPPEGLTRSRAKGTVELVCLAVLSSLNSLRWLGEKSHLTLHPFVQRIQQKLLWWEKLTGLLQSQPALLQQEVSLRQSLIATLLEQLTSDDVLAFSDMENILSEVQATLTESLQLCTDGKKEMWSRWGEVEIQ